MAGMGPPPKPHRRRQNATLPMVSLPSSGRKGKTPAWPLGPDTITMSKLQVARDRLTELESDDEIQMSDARITRARERVAFLEQLTAIQAESELALWREVWATPQAVQWERLQWTRTVAQYVRWSVHGENGNLEAAKEARQLADRLGLSPLALLRLRWEIVDMPGRPSTAAEPPPAATGPGTVTPISRRQRLSQPELPM